MISVCIATYNGEKYIKEQLDSIRCQLSESDEIIISDDSSTDATLKIIENINDNRIKILPNNTFRSPIFNSENALKHAKGDYIFLSDQDDIWMPEKVMKMKSELLHKDLCISDCMIIDADGVIIEKSFFEMHRSSRGFWKNLTKNTYIGCCMAFKREILKYVLPFPSNIAMHDIWIGLSVELMGTSVFIKDKLIKYRRHDRNASPTSKKSQYSFQFKIHYRFIILYQLLKRKIQYKYQITH